MRNYEACGFLPPVDRSDTGYRMYTRRHLHALRTARNLILGYGWKNALTIMQSIHQDDLDLAFALVNARHAELDRKRQQVDQTLDAIRRTDSQIELWTKEKRSGSLRVGEVAKLLGVRVSTLHYWEDRGLLNPIRDQSSRYRLYDEQQFHRLQVIVFLKEVGYDFDTLHSMLEEMTLGKLERTLAALENRRKEITSASRACIQATASLWEYMKQDS